MSITSLNFCAFVILLVVIYYVIPQKLRWIWLLISSVFYLTVYDLNLSKWLFVTIFIVYLDGIWLDICNKKYDIQIALADKETKKTLKKKSKHVKSIITTIGVVANIGIWIYFKFTDMFIGYYNEIFSAQVDLLNLAAPLGISFYTLQAVGYIIDVKRGKIEAQKNPAKLALWLAFFPQMIQGPICRYSDTAEQLFKGSKLEYINIKYGAQQMLWGYFKKLIVANYSAVIVNTIFNGVEGQYKGLEYVIGIALYAIQIYCDFSGGIDIIAGIAEMLGIMLPVNFKRPYFSRGIAEYWRRWHITLGTWFRDYIFYPLSISGIANKLGKKTRKIFGNKLGKMIPTYIALIIVWSSNGIWHGAGLRYFMYGFYNGILITVGMQCGEAAGKFADNILKLNREAFSWKLFQILRTFSFICIGRILFKADTVLDAMHIYKSILTDFNPWILFDGTLLTYGLSAKQLNILMLSMLVLLIVSLLQEYFETKQLKLRDVIAEQNIGFRWTVYLVAIVVVLVFGMYGSGYSATDFIYMKF